MYLSKENIYNSFSDNDLEREEVISGTAVSTAHPKLLRTHTLTK